MRTQVSSSVKVGCSRCDVTWLVLWVSGAQARWVWNPSLRDAAQAGVTNGLPVRSQCYLTHALLLRPRRYKIIIVIVVSAVGWRMRAGDWKSASLWGTPLPPPTPRLRNVWVVKKTRYTGQVFGVLTQTNIALIICFINTDTSTCFLFTETIIRTKINYMKILWRLGLSTVA